MERLKGILFLLFLILLSTSCRSSEDRGMSKSMAPKKNAMSHVATESGNAQRDQSAEREPDEVGESPERKIIREGDIHFQTENLATTDKQIKAICTQLNAQIHYDNVSTQQDRVRQRITIKVPSGEFGTLVESVMQVIDKVDSKNIRLQDVTEEFVDVEARLLVRKQLEARYVGLLDKASTIKELINVEKELKSIREEIESTEGRLKYLQSRTSISTLNLHFYQSKAGYFGFIGKLKRAFINGWYAFLEIIVVLAHAWPFILIGLGVLSAILWRRKPKKLK